MLNSILVVVGGGAGALARYLLGSQLTRALGTGWPYGTGAANLLGGFCMGLLAGWLAHRGGAGQEKLRLLLGVGVLGGFTTFSAFSLETALMVERREYGPAFAYATGSVVLAVAALFAGLLVARRAFA